MEKYQVVGMGRIGSFLGVHGLVRFINRGEAIVDMPGPIYVCTRNDSLRDVIELTPASKRQDLVFIQNGMIAPILEAYDLHKNTQGLIYFAVQSKGAQAQDGGESVVWGKWAAHFCELGAKLGVLLTEVDQASFEKKMFEKLIWNCVFGLLGETTGTSVGEIVENHKSDVQKLTEELRSIANQFLTEPIDEGLLPRMFEYSVSVASFKGGLKEYAYRNGWFVNQRLTPHHKKLLHSAGIAIS